MRARIDIFGDFVWFLGEVEPGLGEWVLVRCWEVAIGLVGESLYGPSVGPLWKTRLILVDQDPCGPSTGSRWKARVVLVGERWWPAAGALLVQAGMLGAGTNTISRSELESK